MTTVSRPLSVGLLGATIALFALPASALERTIRVERNASGTVVQEFSGKVRFDQSTRDLIIDTSTGNRRCGSGGSVSRLSGDSMLLDGLRYEIRDFDYIADSRKPVTVRPSSKGIFPLCTAPAAGKSAGDQIRAPGQLELDIEVAVGGVNGRKVVPLSSNALYLTGTDRIRVPIAENVICMEFNPGSGVGLELVDSYGVNNGLVNGLSSIVYHPFAGGGSNEMSMRIDTTDDLVCVAVPGSTRGAVAPSCNNVVPDRIFAGGFGDAVSAPPPDIGPPGVDLQVDFVPVLFPTVAGGGGSDEPGIYDIIVTNCGMTNATNVQLRDLYPRGNSAVPRMEGQTSTWECVSGGVCSPDSGNGYIDVNLGNMASQQSITVRATRSLDSSANNQVGQQLEIVAAAMPATSDGETLLENNTSMWNLPVQLINNLPPVVTLTQNTSAAILEDSSDIQLTGLTIRATDDDGTVQSIAVTSDTPSLISNGNIDVNSSNLNNILVSVTPTADQNGTAVLRLVATDNEGSTSTPVFLNVPVTAVNDPPRFSVKGEFSVDVGSTVTYSFGRTCDWPHDTITDPNSGDQVVECAEHIWPSNVQPPFFTENGWMFDMTSGPTNESDSVSYSTSIIWTNQSGMFNVAIPPSVDEVDGEFEYLLTGLSGIAIVQITATDDGGTANGGSNETVFNLRIEVENSSPEICGLNSTGIGDCQPITGPGDDWPAALNEDRSNHCDAGPGPFTWNLKTEENLDNGCETNVLGGGVQNWGIMVFDEEGDSVQSVVANAVNSAGLIDNSILVGPLTVVESGGVYEVQIADDDIAQDASGTAYIAFTVTDSAGSSSVSDPIPVEVRSVNDAPEFTIAPPAACGGATCDWDELNSTLTITPAATRGLVSLVIDPLAVVDTYGAGEDDQATLGWFLSMSEPLGCDTGDNGVIGFYSMTAGVMTMGYCTDAAQDLDGVEVGIELRDNGGTDFGGTNSSGVRDITIIFQ